MGHSFPGLSGPGKIKNPYTFYNEKGGVRFGLYGNNLGLLGLDAGELWERNRGLTGHTQVD